MFIEVHPLEERIVKQLVEFWSPHLLLTPKRHNEAVRSLESNILIALFGWRITIFFYISLDAISHNACQQDALWLMDSDSIVMYAL